MRFKKILVVCPANTVTGGPEALHQLVNHMCSLGLSAAIVYYPFDKEFATPLAYQDYGVPVEKYADEEGNIIIFPEIYPYLALKVKQAKAGLWWLSLDNFLEKRYLSPLRDGFRYFKKVLKGERPLRGAKDLKNLLHFSQTEHSTRYLVECGITPIPLIDSINEGFLTDRYLDKTDHKQNRILYNATKGKNITEQLIAAYPDWEFVGLKGLNREQLSEKLYHSKIYMDFGHHPGRDRMPREAAMHGCCLITGILGSAGNDVDLPIPSLYKLDSRDALFVEKFGDLAADIFKDFDKHYQGLDSYRKWLQNEPSVFKQQIADYFN